MPEERILSKLVPLAILEIDTHNPTLNPLNSDWELFDLPTSRMVWRGFIDLTGKTVNQEKTFYTVGSLVQEGAQWIMFDGDPTVQNVIVWDIVSTRPLSNEQLLKGVPPGFTMSTDDWDQIVYGEWRQFAKETTLPLYAGLRQIAGSSFGSGSPTISDRLYVTRVLFPEVTGPASSSGSMIVPPARFVLSGLFDEEEELERIWRMRRSYELQEPNVAD